ncbi:glycosyltransferase [Paraburkholderia bannensis]|uniref:glycosyltransferase n=1 Tax=Paraburkholderia bannensis TaxID=765414 RepID=UPI002AB2CCED|nr:hypothetical protein [Paraburkholderia bannensis]
MKNIVYFCPSVDFPVGGVKVIHRHAELIDAMGARAEVFYCWGEGRRVEWFRHAARIRAHNRFSPDDFVLLPESLVGDLWARLIELDIEYGVFVQNGYLVTRGTNADDLAACYARAKCIACISEDAVRCVLQLFPDCADKIVQVTYSVDDAVFRAVGKERLITYMPRKMPEHSALVSTLLRRSLQPAWSIQPIDNMSEVEVAAILARSRIFLAFSELEGLPVPPVEAAFCGNFVIGYTGQGGKEYWHAPVFESIESGDVMAFTAAVQRRVHAIETHKATVGDNLIFMLKERFSMERERKTLANLIARIEA